MQVNRYIKDNPALNDVDHALGRPFQPFDTYRSHYATDCPEQVEEFRKSEWWTEGLHNSKLGTMRFFHVTEKGRKALADELKNTEKYGRLYSITSKGHDGENLVMAKSPSQAKYKSYCAADIDWMTFVEYCSEIRVRLK